MAINLGNGVAVRQMLDAGWVREVLENEIDHMVELIYLKQHAVIPEDGLVELIEGKTLRWTEIQGRFAMKWVASLKNGLPLIKIRARALDDPMGRVRRVR